MKKINIAWLYPDLLNLHGDRGNLMAFERISKQLNIECNIKRIDRFEDEIDYDNTDIMFFNVGEIPLINEITNRLKKDKEKLDKYIEDGKFLIVIGTTGAVFGKTFTYKDLNKIDCLGYLDMDCTERENVYGNDLYFKLDDMEIIGSQIQMMDIKLNGDSLGKLEYGMGNDNKTEGARYKNLIFTNCLGPVFVKNPWFTEYIISKVLKTEFKNKYELEEKSLETIKKYIEVKDL